jgi:hypothetical protein
MDKHILNDHFTVLISNIISTLDIFRNVNASDIFISIESQKVFSYFGSKGCLLASIRRINPDCPIHDHPEKRYIMSVHLKNFWYTYPDPGVIARLTTIIHELFHIDSTGSGLRFLPSKVSVAHGNSGKVYDYFMALFVEQYLMKTPKKELHRFLAHKSLSDLSRSLRDPFLLSVRKTRHHPMLKISSIKMSEFDLRNPHTAESYH